MKLSLLLLNQVGIMLILMSIGYYTYKKGFFSSEGSKDFGSILMYVVTPMVVIKSFSIEYTQEKTWLLFISFLLAIVAQGLSIIVAYVFFKKDKVLNFATAFPSTGFIGIPLVYNTLGPSAVFFIVSYATLTSIGQWTYGILTLTGDRKMLHISKITKNPMVVFTLIGLLLYFTQVQLPGLVTQTVNYIAPLNTPLAMFVIGGFIARIPLKEIFNNLKIYFSSFIRLIFIPILTAIILLLIPSSSETFATMKIAVLIVASAPVGVNITIFAQKYGQDAGESVKVVCLSALLSIITIPMILYLYTLFA